LNDDRFASAFGSVADEYERGRPGYPAAAFDAVTRELDLSPRSQVIDLAAGTGKLTRDLAERFDRVVAIEPLAEMRAQLEHNLPQVEALDGTAERMPVADASADAIFVAQAFHWFDGSRALTEIARVLRPGGGLALLWNTTPWERRETPWFARLDDVLERSRADLSTLHRHASGRWQVAFDGETRFAPLAGAAFDNTQRMSPEDFLAGFESRSYVAVLDAADRAAVMADAGELLENDDAPLEDGHVVVPMQTACFWTRLTAAQ